MQLSALPCLLKLNRCTLFLLQHLPGSLFTLAISSSLASEKQNRKAGLTPSQPERRHQDDTASLGENVLLASSVPCRFFES
eukprot:851333-Amorphochlora_amoeboformis.AAC.1